MVALCGGTDIQGSVAELDNSLCPYLHCMFPPPPPTLARTTPWSEQCVVLVLHLLTIKVGGFVFWWSVQIKFSL